jgi:hypothetical protein
MAGPWEQYAPTPAGPWAQYNEQPAERGFMDNVADFFKSIPRGMVSGATSAPNPSMVPMDDYNAQMEPLRQQSKQVLIDQTYAPKGTAGKFGEAVGEGLGSPYSYIGPGGAALKIGGAVASSAAGEAGRQLAEGTPFEKPAQLAGSVAGGATAFKALGPSSPKAATPTYRELRTESDRLYNEARNSGVEFHPQGVSQFATKAEQELSGPNHGFTGGQDGDAPRTFAVLQRLQSPPPGATVTASNVDALRKNIARLSRETNEGKPTPDAAAASILLGRLNSYLEAPPRGHVVAGDPEAYVRLTKEANGNYAAGQRLRDWQTKLDHAELDAAGQIAGSVENRTKIAARQTLKSPKASRGLDEAERGQLELINSGGPVSNTLRNAGRGGAGVIPIMGQLAAAPGVFAAAGPVGLGLQASLAAGLYGARKGSEAITSSRANKLAEMLAQRSPEFQRRVSNLPPPDTAAGKAALLRALLGAQ